MFCYMKFLLVALSVCKVTGPEINAKDEAVVEVDPLDMLNYDPRGLKMGEPKVAPVQPALKAADNDKPPSKYPDCSACPTDTIKVVSDCNGLMLKRLLRKWLKILGVTEPGGKGGFRDQLYEATLRLSGSEQKFLRNFLDKEGLESMHDIDETRSILERFLVSGISLAGAPGWYERAGAVTFTVLQVLNVLVLIPACAILLRHFLGMSRGQVAWIFLFLTFVVSSIWTWFHLYKTKLAEREVRIMETVPEECRPSYFSIVTDLRNWWRSMASFKPTVSQECREYQTILLVDPLWEVTPMDAVVTTLSRFFLLPLGHLGEHLAKFYSKLLGGLPVLASPVALGCTVALAMFFSLLCFNYRLRLPFFLGALEPAPRQHVQPLPPPLEPLPPRLEYPEILRPLPPSNRQFDAVEQAEPRQALQETARSSQSQMQAGDRSGIERPDWSAAGDDTRLHHVTAGGDTDTSRGRELLRHRHTGIRRCRSLVSLIQ